MENIIITLNDYRKELARVTKELQTLPLGWLAKRKTFYMHVINDKEFGITKNHQLIRQLCRKKTLLIYKKQLELIISSVSQPISNLKIFTIEEIIQSLPSAYQGLPKSYFYHTSIDEWVAKPYKKNPFPFANVDDEEGEGGYEAENGIFYKSKSEYIISDLLNQYDIPNRYEDEIILEGKKIYPDFKIIKPYSGTLILWEHFGGLHLPGYGAKMNKKMNLYIKHGLIPFKTLICTFEPDIKNTRFLRSLIENIILRD